MTFVRCCLDDFMLLQGRIHGPKSVGAEQFQKLPLVPTPMEQQLL